MAWNFIGASPGDRAPPHPTERRHAMRFMVIVKASTESEAGKMPGEKMLAQEERIRARAERVARATKT